MKGKELETFGAAESLAFVTESANVVSPLLQTRVAECILGTNHQKRLLQLEKLLPSILDGVCGDT